MIKQEKFLMPFKPDPPAPHHTELKPRCFTCSHFDVCQIKQDYLKAAQLIQNIIGGPCESYKITLPLYPIKGFEGTLIENTDEYFPEEITTTNNSIGKFYAAKYIDSNTINFIYMVEQYYVMFTAIYNEETAEFDIPTGKEVYYGIECSIAADIDLLQLGLLSLKEDIETPTEESEVDIINTTYFAAALDCSYYNWEKGLSYEDGVARILRRFPDGVPLENGEIYHLATYHKENGCVPYYHPENGIPVLAPMPFPVMLPPKCKPKCPPRRRDELNEL